MHHSFREGFEKRAWWGESKSSGEKALGMMGYAKQKAKDFGSGVGIGKGITPKVFGGLTVLDAVSKTKDMMGGTKGMLTGIKL